LTEPAQKSGSLTVPAFWLMFAKALAFVLGFALPLLLVRRLNQFEFGLYKQVFLVVSTSITVLPLGFSLSAYYFLPREVGDQRRTVVLNILCFNVAIGLTVFLLLVIKPSILASLFGAQTVVSYAPLIGLVIMLWMGAMFTEIAAICNHEARLATFFIVFALLQIPIGVFFDRFGVRQVLPAMLLIGVLGAFVFAVDQSAPMLMPGEFDVLFALMVLKATMHLVAFVPAPELLPNLPQLMPMPFTLLMLLAAPLAPTPRTTGAINPTPVIAAAANPSVNAAIATTTPSTGRRSAIGRTSRASRSDNATIAIHADVRV